MRASRATAKAAARALRCNSQQILVCSTGVIGVPLPVEKIIAALPDLARNAAQLPAATKVSLSRFLPPTRNQSVPQLGAELAATPFA